MRLYVLGQHSFTFLHMTTLVMGKFNADFVRIYFYINGLFGSFFFFTLVNPVVVRQHCLKFNKEKVVYSDVQHSHNKQYVSEHVWLTDFKNKYFLTPYFYGSYWVLWKDRLNKIVFITTSYIHKNKHNENMKTKQNTAKRVNHLG